VLSCLDVITPTLNIPTIITPTLNIPTIITPTLNIPTIITPTINIPTIITPTLNISTVTDSLCNSGAFSNPNAVRDCPFNFKGAWFLSRSQKFFFVCSAIVFKAFQRGPTKLFTKENIISCRSNKNAFSD
jgi:hypothetical protein